jgi:hypothetical protein
VAFRRRQHSFRGAWRSFFGFRDKKEEAARKTLQLEFARRVLDDPEPFEVLE